jgi:hypothetical protein
MPQRFFKTEYQCMRLTSPTLSFPCPLKLKDKPLKISPRLEKGLLDLTCPGSEVFLNLFITHLKVGIAR